MAIQDKLTDTVDNQVRVEVQEDPQIAQAQNLIKGTFGDDVSVTQKAKTLRKFGRNGVVGSSFETVWNTSGDEPYVNTNAITTIVSSNAGDDQDVVIEGHTISGGELTFVVQSATLNGTTDVTLTTPLARATRLYNNDTTDFAGNITAEESDGTVHLTVSEGNQSEKGATSISINDYYLITSVELFVFTKADRVVEFIGELREVGTTNKVWRRVYSATATSKAAPHVEYFNPPFVIPKNHDLRLRAKSDGQNADVGGAFNGYLAKII
jgi:hypothetical protein